MLKFVNLKKLTAKTLIGILMVGGFTAQTGTKKAVASDDVQGIELRYAESAFQCGADNRQADIRVEVYDKSDNSLLTTLSKGDTYTSDDYDSLSDFDLIYKIYDFSHCSGFSDGTVRSVGGSMLLSKNDSVPEVAGFSGQSSVGQIHSSLDSYEELLLVELGSSNENSASYDLQDVVLVVDDNPASLVAQTDSDTDVETVTSSDTITLTGTLRDFRGYRDKNGNINDDGHEDFERKNNVDTNPSGQKFKYGLDREITTDTLGADKKPVYADGSFSTTTKENFDQWYRDEAGVNQSMTYDIVLNKKAGSDIYSFNNNGQQFFPLDGLLMGNEGRNHNFHFTYEIHTEFTYQGGETFNFSGDDDVWVYIDGKKVIDIGGVHGKTDASVNLDSLGLTQGETYSLDFFFAERHVTQSNFKIETTIELETAPDPDADEDNDGIPNILEGFDTEVDSDGDGIEDYLDDDSDNNGIPDSEEVGTAADPSDNDGDLIPNFQDDDDDGNGILDIDEIGDDPNNPTNTDGTDLPDYQDTDDDNDGINDVDDGMEDSELDDDDIANYHDLDSDGDGISDADEGDEDFDGDEFPNFLDVDSDGDGILDSVETGEDSPLDDDSDPNFLDEDSDGDGILDENEELADSNDDGETDVDDDDLDNGGTTENVDGEDDGDNYLDRDSDNDGFDDSVDPEPYVYTYAD